MISLTTILKLFVYVSASCVVADSGVQSSTKSQQVLNVPKPVVITKQDQLSDHVGKRIQVTGKPRRKKLGDRITTANLSIPLHRFRFPLESEDGRIDSTVTVTGKLNYQEAYVIPKDAQAIPGHPFQPGATIPEMYYLTEIEWRLVDDKKQK